MPQLSRISVASEGSAVSARSRVDREHQPALVVAQRLAEPHPRVARTHHCDSNDAIAHGWQLCDDGASRATAIASRSVIIRRERAKRDRFVVARRSSCVV